MDAKMKTVAIVLIAMAVCMVPCVASGDSEGAVTETVRLSSHALYRAETVYDEDMIIPSNVMVFKTGSYGHTLMEEYVADPYNTDLTPLIGDYLSILDDRGILTNGDEIVLYNLSNVNNHNSIWITYPNDRYEDFATDLVCKPMYVQYYTQAGERYAIECVGGSARDLDTWHGSGSMRFEDGIAYWEPNSDCMLYISCNQGLPYRDVTLRITGDTSVPAGMVLTEVRPYYIMMAETTYDSDAYYHESYLYIPGSDKESIMLDYISGERTYPFARYLNGSFAAIDDWAHLEDGDTIHIYSFKENKTDRIEYQDHDSDEYRTLDSEVVMEPVNLSFFVKAGDTFTFKFVPVGSSYIGYIHQCPDYETGSTATIDANRSMTITFPTDRYCLEVYYLADGHSEPNGSAALYLVACILVTALVMTVMILAGRGPRWSR